MTNFTPAVAAIHYLLGRTACAGAEGVEIVSIFGRKTVLPYSSIQRCRVTPVKSMCAVAEEIREAQFTRVVIYASRPYAMKMNKRQADDFLYSLKRYVSELPIDFLSEKTLSLGILRAGMK